MRDHDERELSFVCEACDRLYSISEACICCGLCLSKKEKSCCKCNSKNQNVIYHDREIT